MKKIFNFLFLSLLIIDVISCDNEDQEQLIISAKGSGAITAPAPGSMYILNPEENQLNTILTLTWNPADYGVPTEITYKVEFAKSGTEFAEPFLAGSTTNTYLSWNISELNGAAVTAGLLPFVEGELDIRVISTIGSVSNTPQIAELITINITPFTTDLPKIAVPGKHQGWDPPTAPLLAASAFGETDYEGFVWLTIEGDEGFKFLAPDQTGGFFWGNTDWGDDGTYTGKLIDKDGEDNCKVTADGYYLVKADTEALTYSTALVSWGIIGNATPTGWDSDTDMIYDPVTRTLSITLDLVQQDAPDNGIKFRANDGWDLNLGDSGADGTMEFGGDNIGVAESGNYTITLDLSNPREYTYSLVKN